jgi:hypothetical protein
LYYYHANCISPTIEPDRISTIKLKNLSPIQAREKYVRPIKSLQKQLAQHSVLRRNSQLEAQIGLKMSRYGFQMAILK